MAYFSAAMEPAYGLGNKEPHDLPVTMGIKLDSFSFFLPEEFDENISKKFIV